MKLISVILNLTIFFVTAVIAVSYFRRDGKWDIARGKGAFRYFTCLSNVFCAIASLFMALSLAMGTVSKEVLLLKYLGTVTVTVTMMTVLLFLGPSMGGYKPLFEKENLYMHLIGPLLAILTFSFLEKGELSFAESICGEIPVIAYGLLYLYKIKYAPEEKRWPDFYGFNKSGKWPLSYAVMVLGTFFICIGLWKMHGL